MRLQTEKRKSMTPIDVNRASAFSMITSPPLSAKRASTFTPLTGRSVSSGGNNHRRISSASDGGLTQTQLDAINSSNDNGQVLTLPETAGSLLTPGPPTSTARFPALFNGKTSPPATEHDDAASDHSQHDTQKDKDIKEMQELLAKMKRDLEDARHELQEANEARQASETCVEALRQFIAENTLSGSGESSDTRTTIKLPPPPTMTTGDEDALPTGTEAKKNSGDGWGFGKLWGSDSSSTTADSTRSRSNTSPMLSRASSGNGPYGPDRTPSGTVLTAAPVSRKLGGFFSSRSSVSSMQSMPPLQTSAMQRNRSMSDTSSVTEPISPGSDIHGLGSEGIVDIDLNGGKVITLEDGHGTIHIKNLDLEVVR